MSNVKITRTISKSPIGLELYTVVDVNHTVHNSTFENDVAELDLPSGQSTIIIGFTGSVGSKVSFVIETPAGKQLRSAKILRGVSKFTARFFEV